MANTASTPAIRKRNLDGSKQFRIIPSRFPPIALFEQLVTADELEIAYAIESMTNDRVQAEAGELYLLSKEQWVSGPGASVVMAAFTHIGRTSRFSDGSYGVYYAALERKTAIDETVFHTERRLRETQEPPIEVDMRCYMGEIQSLLEDIRSKAFEHLRDPDLSSWPHCQTFGAERREAGARGLLYRSARNTEGQCIAAFTPGGVSLPQQTQHLRYCWNGEKIDRVMSIEDIFLR